MLQNAKTYNGQGEFHHKNRQKMRSASETFLEGFELHLQPFDIPQGNGEESAQPHGGSAAYGQCADELHPSLRRGAPFVLAHDYFHDAQPFESPLLYRERVQSQSLQAPLETNPFLEPHRESPPSLHPSSQRPLSRGG